MSDDLVALNGDVHLVHEDFERSEVGFIPVDLGEVPSGLVDSSDRRTRLCLLFLHFTPSLGELFAKL